MLHSKDKQYNTIIDLIINFSEKTQVQSKNIVRLLDVIETVQNKHKKTLDKLEQNFDYLKSQGLELDRRIQYLNNKFNIENIPTKIEIEKLIRIVTDKPKELEEKTTEIITQITRQVEIVTTEVTELKRIIEQLEDKLLS